MLFSSVNFLFVFLPLVLIGYSFAPARFKNLLLLLASLTFYAWGERKLVAIMLVLIIANFFSGKLIGKGYKKSGLFLALSTSLGVLGFFKYANFAFDNFNRFLSFAGISEGFLDIPSIILPLGISFYTFQTLSYSIDVYKGNVKPANNFIDFATYVSLFPQLIAGPIVRYIDVEEQLKSRNINIDKIALGIERFIIGLAKKLIIANTFASVADQIFSIPPENVSTSVAWIGIVAYTIQIYFDFSAYSDMAIGLGKMFGFNFLENFNYPYISKSIQEFWRRWHISLSSWFRDYLYIPLGGNRKSVPRTYTNLLIVFLATGLWHGASWNFIVWGLFHGLFLVLERVGLNKILTKLWTPLRHAYTLLIVLIGWVFFRADNLSVAISYLKSMFFFTGNGTETIFPPSYFINRETIIVGCLALVFSLPVFPYLRNKLQGMIENNNIGYISYKMSLLFLLVLLSAYLAVDTYNPFIYFRF